MSRPPSPNAPDAAAGHSQAAAEEPTCHLEARYCPSTLPFARGDLQQDIIEMLKNPVDNDHLKEGLPDTEFNRKYPPDDLCEESAPNARVWKICRDEATASDRDMLESWNKTLDVLLIFAGLFSAVSTAFLVESYKTLQPDYSQYIATFLYSAAVAYNNSGSALPPLDVVQSPGGPFQSTAIERWINGLWFISLTISLLVALLSILIKQWLDEYRARISRSSQNHIHWTWRRTLYYKGLQSWGVPVLISCLPLLLHVSLFLFLAGLVLFLQLLDAVIARAVLVILVLLLGLYVLSMVLPAFFLDCPSRTQVLGHARHVWSGFLSSLVGFSFRSSIPWLRHIESFLRRTLAPDKEEEEQLFDTRHRLNASAVVELVNSTDDPDILTVVADALGDFSADSLTLLIHDSRGVFYRLYPYIFQGLSCRPVTRGFQVASYARFRRSQIAVDNIVLPVPSCRRALAPGFPDLQVALGVEGSLLCVLEQWEPRFTSSCGIRNLAAALRNMYLIPESRRTLILDYDPQPPPCLHTSFCLFFLHNAARVVELSDPRSHRRPLSYSPHFYSLVMLVFCAARFASEAHSYEAEAAARSLIAIVQQNPSYSNTTIFLDGGSFGELIRARTRSIEALYTMLAHTDEYNIHPDVADSVAPYILSLTAKSYTLWADRKGLSDLILSDSFERYTTSVDELVRLAEALGRSHLSSASGGPQRTKEFLLCASALASRASSLDFSPEQYCDTLCGSLSDILCDLTHNAQENNESVILSHFLSDATVLERWMELFWHCSQDSSTPAARALDMRTLLAVALACAFRRRSRMNLEVKPEWMHALFSSRFAVQIAGTALRICVSEGQAAFFWVKSFLRHWRHLSPSSWSSLCDHLHNSREESGIAEEDIERFRNGVLPRDINGAADIDCESRCGCRRPYAPESDHLLAGATHPPASGNFGAIWKNRLKLWRPGTKREQPDGAKHEENSAAVAEV